MQEKIKWYQEVLELEPGSKVFFPLARLLVQTGQVDAALQALQQGLARHPEFIEARLYLIDVLFTHNRSAQCNEQVSALTGLFANYTGFWQAWGAYLAHSEQGKEVSLALTFLAASFQNPQLRLSDVFTQGLQNLNTGKLPSSSNACAPAPSSPSVARDQDTGACSRIAEKCQAAGAALPPTDMSAAPAPDFQSAALRVPDFSTALAPTQLAPPQFSPESIKAPSSPLNGDMPAKAVDLASTYEATPTVPPLAELVQSLPAPSSSPASVLHDSPVSASDVGDMDADDADGAEDSDDGEERFSLRTRSMAEVLAEQGDFKNALEIYQELTAQAVTPEEQLDLQHRISTLTARMGSVQGQPTDSPSLPDTAPGKHRLLSLLETLAVRFEAHAQG